MGAGGALGTISMDKNTSMKGLTTDYAETGMALAVNQENQFTTQKGFYFQLSSRNRQQAKTPFGPLNPQAMNRYSYVLNNPMRYSDSTGHDFSITMSFDVYAVFMDNVTSGMNYLYKNLAALGDTAAAFASAIGAGAGAGVGAGAGLWGAAAQGLEAADRAAFGIMGAVVGAILFGFIGSLAGNGWKDSILQIYYQLYEIQGKILSDVDQAAERNNGNCYSASCTVTLTYSDNGSLAVTVTSSNGYQNSWSLSSNPALSKSMMLMLLGAAIHTDFYDGGGVKWGTP